MRPVNLIPPEERRGEAAPTRTGPLAYVVVGVLVVVLAAITGVTLLDNRVSDRKSEATALEATASAVQSRAQSLSGFASFQQIHDARVATVGALARSRFDWQRVLRELSRVTPRHVWLTQLVGTVSPEVQVQGGSSSELRADVPGPALELTGCGRSQHDVARLVAAMKDIDGVTRVTVSDSAKPEPTPGGSSAGGASAGGASAGGDSCQTRSTIPQFSLIAAFDAVEAPTVPAAPPAPTATSTAANAPTGGVVAPDPGTGSGSGTPTPDQTAKIDTATGLAGGS